MPANEQEWLQRARQGEQGAFAALVEGHTDSLFRLACSLTGRVADAEDALQETLLGAMEALPRFRGESSLRTWLTRILVRQIAQQRRRQKVRRTATLECDDGQLSTDPSLQQPSTAAAADARMDLAQLLEQISPEHRQVIVLRELQGLSYQEIADILQLPRGTIESRLFRARESLKEWAQELNREPLAGGRKGASDT